MEQRVQQKLSAIHVKLEHTIVKEIQVKTKLFVGQFLFEIFCF
jgi:hypothetical protein